MLVRSRDAFWRFFWIASAAALLCAGAATARSFSPAVRARLDRALRTTLAGSRAPGAIVGVWQAQRAWTQTAGVIAPGARKRPSLTEHTRIGSVTKTFTGTLILQLVDQGRLKLSDRISRWFPHVPYARQITIRDLGDMSSSIANYTQDERLTSRFLADPFKVWSPQELIHAGTRMKRLPFAPGHGFSYSNTNFVMLGRIVELVTHRPLAQVMRQHIFLPLGMRHTSYPLMNRLPAPFWHGYTMQSVESGPAKHATFWSPSFAGAAGQSVSTLGDLRIWTRALGRGTLLRPSTQQVRLVPNRASVSHGRAYLFALGSDHDWLAHSGELPGYNTQIGYLPAQNITIVVQTNSDIATQRRNPAPAIFAALARVIAPRHTPTG